MEVKAAQEELTSSQANDTPAPTEENAAVAEKANPNPAITEEASPELPSTEQAKKEFSSTVAALGDVEKQATNLEETKPHVESNNNTQAIGSSTHAATTNDLKRPSPIECTDHSAEDKKEEPAEKKAKKTPQLQQ